MSVVALVPARSGSRGIPGKNFRLLGDKPLWRWSVDAAKEAGTFDEVWVSSDDPPPSIDAMSILRPACLAADDTPMVDVVRHAIETLNLDNEDIVVLLQPTSPFRSVESIHRCVEALDSDVGRDIVSPLSQPSACMTVLRVPDRFHPDQIIGPKFTRGDKAWDFPATRQCLAPRFVRAGTVYAFYAGTARCHGNIYGENCGTVEVPESEALNLDEMADWHEAERRVKEENRATKAAQPSSVQSEEQAQPTAL